MKREIILLFLSINWHHMPLDDYHKNWNFLWILGWIWFTHMDDYNFSIFHWSSLLYKSSLHSQYGGCNFYWKTSGIETIQFFLWELRIKPHTAATIGKTCKTVALPIFCGIEPCTSHCGGFVSKLFWYFTVQKSYFLLYQDDLDQPKLSTTSSRVAKF